MALVVQKYGGTSVGSTDRIRTVAQRVAKTAAAGNQVVVVVSAMGKSTDTLVALAADITSQPSQREMDMLLSTGEQVSISLLTMALQELGQPARSMTGAQVGIVTEAHHTRARILSIKPDRLRQALDKGEVVVVAGFQGMSNPSQEDGDAFEITTLGRGGSDTSAVALAAALGADHCEICTDVPGILTTDPRLVPEASQMDEVTCDEMLELASLGASVLHPRAVEIARNYGIPVVVRSSWTDQPGTWVRSQPAGPRSLEGMEIARPVDGIELDLNQAKVALLQLPDRPGIAATLFGELAQQQLPVDLIIQSINEGHTNDIAFTVKQADLDLANQTAGQVYQSLSQEVSGAASPQPSEEAIVTDGAIAKVSISGAGMIGRPGVAAQMFQSLSDAEVNIQMISTSEVKVSCLVNADQSDLAIAALCKTFEIHSSSIAPSKSANPQTPPPVRGVALDRSQAQVAIRHVPDRPGMAARIFTLLAEAQVSVDMIIQSQRCSRFNGIDTRDIAFTVARDDAARAQEALADLVENMGCAVLEANSTVAKVSVVGAGMVAASGVAAQMFAALAKAQINIRMIATSEIKISCLVDEAQAVEALKIIHQAFALEGNETVEVPA